MAQPMEAALPEELLHQLGRVRSRVRQVWLWHGVGMIALALSSTAAVGLFIDFAWQPSPVVRLVWLCLSGALVAIVAGLLLLRPFFRRLTAAELAAIVEASNPALGERLTSTVELSDPNVPEQHKGSSLMRELLTRQTLRSISKLEVTGSISATRAARLLSAGAIALCFLAAPFLTNPTGYSLLWSRFLMPWGNFSTAGGVYFVVDGGDRVVARGTDVTIRAVPRHDTGSNNDSPKALWLTWTNSGDHINRRRMELDEEHKSFSLTLPRVLSDFDFHVASGKHQSRRYFIRVVDAPRITEFQLDVEPPAYTGLPAATHEGVRDTINAFEQSRLKFRLKFNKPIVDVEWQWFDASLSSPNSSPNRKLQTNRPTPKIEIENNGHTARVEMTAESDGTFALKLTDAHALHNMRPTTRRLKIIRDEPPKLSLSGSKAPQTVRSDAIVRVSAEAIDDIGVAQLELHYNINKTADSEKRKAGNESVVAVESSRLGMRSITHEFSLELKSLGLSDGDILSYRVRAADERPVPRPNEVWSETRKLKIDPKAAAVGTADLSERHKRLGERLQNIRTELNESRRQGSELKTEAEKSLAKGKDFAHSNQMQPFARQQRRLATRLGALADDFSRHPLFTELTVDTRKVARQELAQAAASARQAADAALKEKPAPLANTLKQLAAADQKLADIQQRFEKLSQLERDLLELNHLAREAERLARATRELQQRLDNPPANETAQQKQLREQQLADDRNRLQNEQKQLAGQLDDLLKRRPELIEAARQHQLDQLADLAREAAELAKPQKRLAETLLAEADRTANDVAPLSKKYEELRKQAEQLAAEARALRPDVKPKLDAQQKAAAALKEGNLNEARKQLEKAADELERLSKKLADEKPSPPSDKANPPAEKPVRATKPTDPKPKDPKSKVTPSNKTTEQPEQLRKKQAALRKKIDQLARQQRQLQQQLAQQQQERQKQQQQHNQNQTQAQKSDQANKRSDSKDRSEPQNQQQLARQAAQLALDVARSADPQSSATEQATKAARHASQADQNSRIGRLVQAAENSRQAAIATRKAAETLTRSTQKQPPHTQLKRRAEQLAKNHQRSEKELLRQSKSAAQRTMAQNRGQRQLASQTQELANRFAQVASNLSAAPLNLKQPGEGAKQARARAVQAQQQMQHACELLGHCDQGSSAQSARQAAQLLQTAATLAKAAAGDRQRVDVPGSIADQVAEAARRLEQARKQLDNARQQAANAKGQQSPKTAGKASGQSKSAQKPHPGSNAGEPNQGQAGNKKQGPLAQSAKNLDQAARALAQASRQLKPRRDAPGNQPPDPNAPPAMSTKDGTRGTGAKSPPDLQQLEIELKRLTKRQWGQLPGHLRTEIIQAARKQPNDDYAKLIQLYFREIAEDGN